ncbi:flavin reductase [Granulosicoccaceae sp. 1_MG-2023]|nr:flavin reductase [Granulosicoccaceae sp. 1_MG-2023]
MDITDTRELRNAFGRFLTGVTVISCKDADGHPRGFTANSFTSVSLDPPLLLVCIDKKSASREAFETSAHFAVNILSENQKEVSNIFASRDADKFERVPWRDDGPSGCPLLYDIVAYFECARENVIEAGDHIILLGRVKNFSHDEITPLGYGHGGYFSPALEQAAVSASKCGVDLIVGAIVEHDGGILLLPGEDGTLELPQNGDDVQLGSLRKLRTRLASLNLTVSLGFLYEVYENPENGAQAIYYRGESHESHAAEGRFYAEQDFPWDKIRSPQVQSMLRRYFDELRQQRFSVVLGEQD